MFEKNKNLDNDNLIQERRIIDQASKLESFMLPPQFRRRSSFWQRFKLITIVLIYAITLGLLSYMIIGGIKNDFNIYGNIEIIYFIISVISIAILLFIWGMYTYWIRSRAYIISLTGFIGYLIAPLTVSAGVIYLSFIRDSNIHEFLEWNSYIAIIAGGAMVLYSFIRTLFKSRTYRESKFRVMWISPGALLATIAPFMLYLLTKDNNITSLDWTAVLISGAMFVGGILLLAIGMAFSSKYYFASTEKNIWSSIRYTAGLPALVIYAMLIALFSEKSFGASINVPIIINIIVDLAILVSLVVFLFLRTGIKNLHSTNPIYNEIVLKIFIVLILSITLVMIYVLPAIAQLKSYGIYSFAIALTGASIIMIGIFISHFMNLITYSRYGKLTIFGIGATTLFVFGIGVVIASLRQSSTIIEIIGRQLSLTFILIVLIFQLITLSINIGYIFINTIKKQKHIELKNKNLLEEIKNNVQNTGQKQRIEIVKRRS